MHDCRRARRKTATRPCERPDILAGRAPGHMQDAHEKRPHSDPPSGSCISQAQRRARASVARQSRRKMIGCQTCKTVRKRASVGQGPVRNAGGWGVAGDGSALTPEAPSIASRRPNTAPARNVDPPRTHQAPRRAQRSPLCARGTATVRGGA